MGFVLIIYNRHYFRTFFLVSSVLFLYFYPFAWTTVYVNPIHFVLCVLCTYLSFLQCYFRRLDTDRGALSVTVVQFGKKEYRKMRAPIFQVWLHCKLRLVCLDTCYYNPQKRDPGRGVTIEIVFQNLKKIVKISRLNRQTGFYFYCI